MKTILIVGAGGFIGAITRYGINIAIAKYWTHNFPLATFLINVSGSFILGLFMTWATGRVSIDPMWRLFIATGFLGAYTTFSTFEYETQQLTGTGFPGWAAFNVIASVLAGFIAVWLGVRMGR